ncbi:somatostatin-1B-like isoform 4-T4 [Guaruba guarouba]
MLFQDSHTHRKQDLFLSNHLSQLIPYHVSANESRRPVMLRQEEQSTVRKDAILKMLAGLLDSVDVGREVAGPDVEEEGKLEEERAVLGRLAQLSPRDRKAPCKNFFWKTFTSC